MRVKTGRFSFTGIVSYRFCKASHPSKVCFVENVLLHQSSSHYHCILDY